MPKLTQINSAELEEARRFFVTQYEDGKNPVTGYITLDNYENPFKIDKDKLLPNTQQMTLPKFFELVSQLLAFVKTREGQPTIPVVQEYPPLDMSKIGSSVITFRVVKRCPANMSPDSTGGKHVRPIFYNTVQREDSIKIYRRPLDHEIELCAWATTNKEANEMALWIEQTMVAYSWTFRWKGVEVLEFKERLSDGYMNTDNNKIFYRPLRFFLRLNEFTVEVYPAIKEIELELNIHRG